MKNDGHDAEKAKDGVRGSSRPTVAADADAERDPRSLDPHAESHRLPPLAAAEYRAFVADIAARGLTTPLEISPAGIVIDGHERLRAALELELDRVRVRVVEPEDEMSYMLMSALRRKNLTQDQKAALGIELADYEELRARALERSRQNLSARREPEVATLPLRGRTRERLARECGAGARTVQDVLTVREADPALFEQVKAGRKRAHSEAQEIRRKRKLERLGAAPPTPQGPFPLIYADPPWRSDNPNASWAPERHYPTMTVEEIKAISVPATADCVLFLWAVNCQLPEALEVMAVWGFTYKGNAVWVKPSPGIGRWIRNQHEQLLLGVKGKFPCPAGSDTPTSIVQAERLRHSQKPECFYELIERMYPDLPKLELFARGKPREGWTIWGNEADS